MKRPKRILLASPLVVLLGGLLFLAWHASEPSYQGKPLGFWLQGYDPGNYSLAHPKSPAPPTREVADEAVRAIGTNAIPILLQMLEQPNSQYTLEIWPLLRRHHFVRILFPFVNRQMKAFHGFLALGSGASNAVPRLIEMYDRPSYLLQTAVPVILGKMGPTAAPAIPALLRGIIQTNKAVRANVVSALGQIHTDAALVVPALIKCLNDTDAMVRAQAAQSLGEFGPAAQSAVPALLELWGKQPPNSPSGGIMFDDGTLVGLTWVIPTLPSGLGTPDVGCFARQALKAIDPAALANAGVQ